MDIEYVEPRRIVRNGYKEEYGDKLIAHMRTGRSFNSFAGTIMVTPNTVRNWLDTHKEFKEAYEIALSINMGAWEDIAIENANGDTKGNATMTSFMLKNLHSDEYKDKQVVESEGNVTFMIDTGVPTKLVEEAEVITSEIPCSEESSEELL